MRPYKCSRLKSCALLGSPINCLASNSTFLSSYIRARSEISQPCSRSLPSCHVDSPTPRADKSESLVLFFALQTARDGVTTIYGSKCSMPMMPWCPISSSIPNLVRDWCICIISLATILHCFILKPLDHISNAPGLHSSYGSFLSHYSYRWKRACHARAFSSHLVMSFDIIIRLFNRHGLSFRIALPCSYVVPNTSSQFILPISRLDLSSLHIWCIDG